jgi:hypothetical protein
MSCQSKNNLLFGTGFFFEDKTENFGGVITFDRPEILCLFCDDFLRRDRSSQTKSDTPKPTYFLVRKGGLCHAGSPDFNPWAG